MEGQDKFVMRELDNADVGLREDNEEDYACQIPIFPIFFALPLSTHFQR